MEATVKSITMYSREISIVDKLKTIYPVTEAEADIIYPELEEAISNHEKVNLSFDGVVNCASIFLANLIGRLYSNYEADRYFSVSGLDKDINGIADRIKLMKEKGKMMLEKEHY